MAEHVYEKQDRKMSDMEIIRRTWPYIAPYKWKLVLVLAEMLIMVGLDLAAGVLPGYVTEWLASAYAGVKYTYSDIYLLCIGFFIVSLLNSIFIYLTTMQLQKVGQSVIYDLRMFVFEHIDDMSIAQINEIPVGTLVTRVASDTNTLSDLFTNTIVQLFKNLLTLVGVIAYMYVRDWRLASIMMCFLPIVGIASWIFRKYIRANYRRVRHSFSVMNAFLNENIAGMKITQIFNQEERKEAEFSKLNNDILSARKKDIQLFSFFRPLITFIHYLAYAVILFFAVYFYVRPIYVQQMVWKSEECLLAIAKAVGTAQIFYSLVGRFFQPVQNLADELNSLQRAFTSCERLFNVIDLVPDFRDKDDAVDIDHFDGDIEFRHVWFAYKGEDWILKDVSFHVLPRQTVAFVGATGAGKTTILQLIVRNYDIQKGQILIDGKDIRDIKIKSLRKGIGQMLQDVFLFSGSIRSNINLRDNEISDEDIVEACNYVNADQFINKLPNGFEEEVKEGGNNFSSGQRQLLSFARTVVHKPQILILDEATANIDTETEQVIQKSLLKMMNIGTMLIVAHRLSTIQHADNIICLQKGEIIEEGNHQELLKKHGYYYNLYRLQYEDQEQTK